MLANHLSKFQIFAMTGFNFMASFIFVCARVIFPTDSCVSRPNSKIGHAAPNWSKELKLATIDSLGCVD